MSPQAPPPPRAPLPTADSTWPTGKLRPHLGASCQSRPAVTPVLPRAQGRGPAGWAGGRQMAVIPRQQGLRHLPSLPRLPRACPAFLHISPGRGFPHWGGRRGSLPTHTPTPFPPS